MWLCNSCTINNVLCTCVGVGQGAIGGGEFCGGDVESVASSTTVLFISTVTVLFTNLCDMSGKEQFTKTFLFTV